jgi:hypothetical protein
MAGKGSDSSDSSASLPKDITAIIRDLAEDEIDGNKFIESLNMIILRLEQIFFKFEIYLFFRIRVLEPKA